MTKKIFTRRLNVLFFLSLVFIFAGTSSSCVLIYDIFKSIEIHGTVSGRYYEDDGQTVKFSEPLEGITVTLYSSKKDDEIASVTTDSKGYYEITISFSSDDYDEGHLSFDDEKGMWKSENYFLEDINKCTYEVVNMVLEPRKNFYSVFSREDRPFSR